MNAKLIQNMAFDSLILWPSFALAITDWRGLGGYGENVVTFFSGLCAVLGVMILFTYKPVAADHVKSGKPCKTDVHLAYNRLTVVAEIFLAAFMGWFWISVGFFVMFVAASAFRTELEKQKAAIND
ncbi:MAG: hypothetical protein RR390_00655 [Hafnia sp.]